MHLTRVEYGILKNSVEVNSQQKTSTVQYFASRFMFPAKANPFTRELVISLDGFVCQYEGQHAACRAYVMFPQFRVHRPHTPMLNGHTKGWTFNALYKVVGHMFLLIEQRQYQQRR